MHCPQAGSQEERIEWVQALEQVQSEAREQASVSVSSLPNAHTGVWIDDSKAQACAVCAKRFNTFIRRHHCRNCGCDGLRGYVEGGGVGGW